YAPHHPRRVDPPGFLDEACLLRHLEEVVEGVKAQIAHFAEPVIDDDAVHQLHLAEGVHDIGGFGDVRQIFEQRRLLQVEVEGRHIAVLEQQEFAEQPRDQRLADLRAGRTDDIDGSRGHWRLYQAKYRPDPAQSPRPRQVFYFSPPLRTDLPPRSRSVD